MGKPLPFLCPVKDCIYFKKPIFADVTQIKTHLMRDHDFKEYQQAAFENRLTPSKMFRSRIFFVNLLCNYGIVRGSSV
ncbi:MAG: hypothetical protein IIA82_09590 [Thaumarchaeota archaeon]|nr:hypothetical protein [Nitrososphaerota archaeon]